MTDADAKLIFTRLDSMEALIERIEVLLQKEISELKTEQIAALREDYKRLADDQRRSWDAIRSLELDRSNSHGKSGAIMWIATGLISICGSSAAAAIIMHFFK